MKTILGLLALFGLVQTIYGFLVNDYRMGFSGLMLAVPAGLAWLVAVLFGRAKKRLRRSRTPTAQGPWTRTDTAPRPAPEPVKARPRYCDPDLPQPAIRFQKVFPPVHPMTSMTFFGGRPRAPDGFDWPRSDAPAGGSLVFLGQIALADLPVMPSGPQFPRDGVLYFFMDSVETEPGTAPLVHVPGPVGDWPELRPPAPAQKVDEWHEMASWAYRLPDAADRYPDHFPKWEMRPYLTETRPEETLYEEKRARDDARIQKLAAMDDDARAALLAAERQDHPLTAADIPGIWLAAESLSAKKQQTLRGMIDRGEALAARAAKELDAFTTRLANASPDLPAQNRAAIQARIDALLRFQASAPSFAAQAKTMETRLGHVVDRAREAGPMSLMSGAEFADFQRLMTDFEDFLETTGVGVLGLTPMAAERDLIIQAAEACLTQNAKAAALVTPAAIEAMRKRHVADGPGQPVTSLQTHQMLGHPANIQGAGDHFPEIALLIQFFYDLGMAWSFGDVGAFQFWIDPTDLEAGRWDRASVTFECH